MSEHHSTTVLYFGERRPARPARDSSWWRRLITEFRCAAKTGHCWHLEPSCWDAWWCCMCSADMDGTPLNNCRYCTE